MSKKVFGKWEGQTIHNFTLKSEHVTATFSELGASIQSLVVYGKEITLGYNEVAPYMTGEPPYFGATIGRVANRIANAKFTLNGVEYKLDQNADTNCLHGGFHGFDRRIFTGKEEDGKVVFTLHSPHMDQGFPGALDLTVTYALEHDELKLTLSAVSDADTLFSPTNHAFFNLMGEAQPVYDTLLTIYADEYTPANEKLLPLGVKAPVKGTPFDFTTAKPIGQDIHADNEQLKLVGGGFDHNYVLLGEHVATAYCPATGIQMDIYTSLPGVQLYSGNFLTGEKCRNGSYGKHTAFCLEPQFFPNAVNTEGFETPLLRKGERATHTIRYAFAKK